MRLKLVGANPQAKVAGVEPLPGRSNYFIGNDPKKWRTNVANYAKVKYEKVYPGIDLVYYGRNSGAGSQESEEAATLGAQLEYDFVVAPGANPNAIALEIETGNSKLEIGNWKLETGNWKFENRKSKIAANGDLVISTQAGEVRFHKPVVFQEKSKVESRRLKVSSQGSSSRADRTVADGESPNPKSPSPESRTPNPDRSNHQSSILNRQSVDGRYVLLAGNRVGFELGAYDRTRPLVIDPVLSYSTYLGGDSADNANAIAVDSLGNVFVAGQTVSTDFPTVNPVQGINANPNPGATGDAFVTKINATGDAIVYSSYLGGTFNDYALGIALDGFGDAFLTGLTESDDFPTQNPLQPHQGLEDAFVTQLNATGDALVYSTYLGGSDWDYAPGIAVDASGSAYVTGYTRSIDFPMVNPLQANLAGDDDVFATKFSPAGDALTYSTYLGGSGSDRGSSIAVDASGNAYVAGETRSTDFPTLNALQSALAGNSTVAFVTKINPLGDAAVYSTYLGGTSGDYARGIAVDTTGNAYVTGVTCSRDFPTLNALQDDLGDAYSAGFVTKFGVAGDALVYSTYLGGAGPGAIAVDTYGSAYVTGNAGENLLVRTPVQAMISGYTDFPDAFVAKFSPAGDALVFSTYLGGSRNEGGYGVAVDASGNAYIAGYTNSDDFPTENPLQPARRDTGGTYGDAFVAKISPQPGPAVALSPRAVFFDFQTPGTTSAAQTVSLTDPGDGRLSIYSIATSGAFALGTQNTCGSTLAPGGGCAIDVVFTPTDTEDYARGTLTVTSNASGSPHSVLLQGPPADFMVSGSNSQTVSAGQTASYGLRLYPIPYGFVGSVTLACTWKSSQPQGARCSVSPTAVSLDGINAAPFTVSVTTAARALALPQIGGHPRAGGDPALPRLPWERHGAPFMLGLMVLMLAAVAWLRGGDRRRRDVPVERLGRRPIGPPLLAAALLALLLWPACGGETGGGGGNTGTPAGTYTLTVTGTYTSGSTSISRTLDLTLKVN
ncbi:MAG: SBBP repeat-containing protein [Terriglobia bacterium]